MCEYFRIVSESDCVNKTLINEFNSIKLHANVAIIMLFAYLTDSSNFLAMPLRLSDLSTHIRLIPHFAGSGSVLQHHGCELSLGLTGDVD